VTAKDSLRKTQPSRECHSKLKRAPEKTDTLFLSEKFDFPNTSHAMQHNELWLYRSAIKNRYFTMIKSGSIISGFAREFATHS